MPCRPARTAALIIAAIAIALSVAQAARPARAQGESSPSAPPPAAATSAPAQKEEVSAQLKAAIDGFIPPTNIRVQPYPNDDGSNLALLFDKSPSEKAELSYVVYVSASSNLNLKDAWFKSGNPSASDSSFVADKPEDWGFPENADTEHLLKVELSQTKIGDKPVLDRNGRQLLNLEGEPIPPKDVYIFNFKTYKVGTPFFLYLAVSDAKGGYERRISDVLTAVPREDWYDFGKSNNLLFSLIFCAVVLAFIEVAKRNPNLFIRKIAGLDAVEEAVGRATEMGKSILYLNGLDLVSNLNTLAAINILGKVARKVAEYESQILVPCYDPIVMTVAQETVRNAFLDAGRPDKYREDNIWYITMEQFAYVAAVNGIMLREKPAANFFFGGYYAESLLLAETGFATGAIQVAGTDSLAQLPFFITTCDYTLIGEELYAASAYLAREPRLLGSLRGQDIGKMFILITVIIGTILLTLKIEWVSHLLVTK